MPHLTLPLIAQGCAVTLYVNVSAERRAALLAAGKSLPTSFVLQRLSILAQAAPR